MRTILEVVLVGVILYLLFDRIAPGSSISLSGTGLSFNEAPGSVGSGYISEGGATTQKRASSKSGGCGCGG